MSLSISSEDSRKVFNDFLIFLKFRKSEFLEPFKGHRIIQKFMKEGAAKEIYLPCSMKKNFHFDGSIFCFDRVSKIAEENLR